MSKCISSALLVFLAASLSTSCNNAALESVTFKGSLLFKDGKQVRTQEVGIKITVSGRELIVDPTCPALQSSDLQSAGVRQETLQTDAQGHYALSLLARGYSSIKHPGCELSELSFEQVESVEVEATIANSQENCMDLCVAESASGADPVSCMSSCVHGERKLLAKGKLTKDQLATEVDLDLVVQEQGPGNPVLKGPDLLVDGPAAQRSARISLESFSPSSCAVQEGCILGTGLRKLLRFEGTIMNLGDEDFKLGVAPASAKDFNPMFEFSGCHGHSHMKEAMLYELIDPSTRQVVQVGSQQVIGRKQGFCMTDIKRVSGDQPGKYNCSNQGLTAGWADVYGPGLDCQWLDITGVPSGVYTLRLTVNPTGRLFESDRTNNSSEVNVVIP